jgi:hypothetical protein
MSASPLSLNFSNIEGQPDPTGQVVSVTNNGHSPLSWHVTASPLHSSTWLTATPPGGTVNQAVLASRQTSAVFWQARTVPR